MSYNAAAAIQMALYSYRTPHELLTNTPNRILKAIKDLWAQIKESGMPKETTVASLSDKAHLATAEILTRSLSLESLPEPVASLSGKAHLAIAEILTRRSKSLLENEINDIRKYIQKNPQTKPTIIRSRKSNLRRTLYFDGKKWYLLFTKTQKLQDILIGKGSYKKVKYAFDLSTWNRYVVGVIRNLDQSIAEIGKKEIALHTLVNKISPHIVNLQASFETKYKTYLILDECDQGDLFELLWKKNVHYSKALTIALDCAKGLEAVHKEKIIHRDLKIENIFLYTDENGKTRAKIGDFGLSCTCSDEKEKKQLQGTLVNFSPERAKVYAKNQIPGYSLFHPEETSYSKSTTTNDDIWALGLCFLSLFYSSNKDPKHEWLCTRNQTDEGAFLDKIANAKQEDINECVNNHINSTIPEALKTLILQMLSIDPEKRPPAEIIAKTLEQIQSV
jgi:hypothetical protein